ncbi:glycosyltransferase [Pseudomonas mosselii]|uniref:glycosyltransferase n=1 Tax=Pseudomonas mosselii TaxID=78327 RepID=UPI00076FE770|nr:glycosyltransferase [Pseudomonas mosselii]AMK31242.1 Glycosyl transferase [Pseudomonas putida]AMK31264.1 Glycosyl transferase group 2 family protein [Pseudomonas putida]MBC3451398.1 glycosyltransferase [Pseudomonas mosselii]MDH1659361.1 glycosyltransferase [Pseudomonas mosselii]MDH1719557.1 glycosyltransferase [Pseudomonas mosselii]
MIAVIIPAHNEARRLGHCLAAVKLAVARAEAAGLVVEVLVVLDRCVDASARIARRHGVHTLDLQAGNVGIARRLGAAWMIERGAQWLAFTDADSRVPVHWLVSQLQWHADAVCGTVHIERWQSWHGAALRQLYRSRYQARDGHRHIHGANLGVCAKAYERVGGFQPLPAHEDVQLVLALEASGAQIVWTAAHSVATSSRRDSRARQGFGDYLNGLEGQLP